MFGLSEDAAVATPVGLGLGLVTGGAAGHYFAPRRHRIIGTVLGAVAGVLAVKAVEYGMDQADGMGLVDALSGDDDDGGM